jgi:hypothetical protein
VGVVVLLFEEQLELLVSDETSVCLHTEQTQFLDIGVSVGEQFDERLEHLLRVQFQVFLVDHGVHVYHLDLPPLYLSGTSALTI